MDRKISSSFSTSDNLMLDTWKHTLLFSFQSLGVIYGRLSTAPLYVFESIYKDELKSVEEVKQFFSFVFWTLTIISLLKYAIIVLRANDNGEGGPFALYSILCRHAKVGLIPDDKCADDLMHYEEAPSSKITNESRARRAIKYNKSSHLMMLFLALFGACMMIGDGVLTPAVSVLSASSGLRRSLTDLTQDIASPRHAASVKYYLKKYVPVPSACLILIGLFTMQHYGTHKIGFIFAPVIIVWLLFMGAVGLYNVIYWDYQILYAISPFYMFKFMRTINFSQWKSLGSILLCSAGSEAMFADLGHFSRKSINRTFVFLVYPILIVSYAGQAAFISKNFSVSDEFNHISESVPGTVLRHVFILLSLLASAVGSQASITATFSIIRQCLALGSFPRVKVIHTSNKIHGQVYIPDFNWILMILSLSVTIGFHDVSRLAYATGLAIVLGMLVTTCLMSLVIAFYWEKRLLVSSFFLIFFGLIESVFLSACFMNFHKGAWCLVVLVVCFMTIMSAWHYGTKKKYEFDLENKVSTEWLTDLSPGLGVSRVPGIGFIYTDIVTGMPAFFSHFITNLPAFHQVLIFVSFKSLPAPYVSPSERYLIGRVGPKEYKIYRCIVRHGYCDQVTDTNDFEDQIILSIGEFISLEESDNESLTSPEGRMIIVGNPNALIPSSDTYLTMDPAAELEKSNDERILPDEQIDSGRPRTRRKKVRFLVPQRSSPKTRVSVREELQQLVDARDSGTAYILGKSQLSVRKGSSFLKSFMIMIYGILDKNCREPQVSLNIPHAALIEMHCSNFVSGQLFLSL